MLEVIERILAAVIVLAIASLLIFAGRNLAGSPSTPSAPAQVSEQRPANGAASTTNSNNRQVSAQRTDGGVQWWKPWTWKWQWPCPSGTKRNAQGTCADAEEAPRQASRQETRQETRQESRQKRRPRPPEDEYRPVEYSEYREYREPRDDRDRRGYYHPEADPTGQYEREQPYIACRDGEACSRRQLCYRNYGYYDRPCYGDNCPYWQRDSYRAAFGYAPFRSHQGDPVPCN